MSLKDFSLDGRTVLITGASSGIGQTASWQAAEHGARVVVTGRSESKLMETFEKLPNKHLNHKFIVQDFKTLADVSEFITKLDGPIDGLVHSAGVSKMSPVRNVSEKILNELHFINFLVPVMITQQILYKRLMKDGGSIVFLSSIAIQMGIKGNGIYASSKAALASIAQNLAIELSPRKIRSNSLAPAMVITPMTITPDSPLPTDIIEKDQASYPLGWGKPEDISNAIIFLLSDASRWITGTTIKMDGGLTLL